jgi:lysozyme family protein
MEIIEKYIKFVKKWEGGLSRDKNDSASSFSCPTPYNDKTGWHTNAGITYAAWVHFYGNGKDSDFYRMPSDMWFKIFKKGYWDSVKGDAYNSQNIAAFVTGMAWGSGPKQAGISLQRVLNLLGKKVTIDGVIGNQTVLAANSVPVRELFDALASERERFFYAIGVGKNAKFLKGWLNRLEDYKKTFRP